MSIKALEAGRYKVDVRPRGRSGRRIQRVFKKKADAVAFERYVLSHMHNKEWLEKPVDQRRLSELLEVWWELGGRNATYADNLKIRLEKIINQMNNPRASQMTKRFMTEYRSSRLAAGVKESTVNRDETVISSMFRLLIEVGECHGDNPIRQLPALREKTPEMTYLTREDIDRLLKALDGDARRLTILCLSTGARWGEANKVTAENVLNNRVTFTKTKNGKIRTVPISSDVMREIKIRESGLLFDVDYEEYRKLLRGVKPTLPKGQAAHVLRHTFAAHFMMNGGNILTLQRIMGHATIQQTMTYAHLAPDFLQDAMRLNPLTGIALDGIR
ncbi:MULTISPECIES: phage integrase [Serratia]|uniref:Tyrosine-type recombinase/integrase n=3 Tax=Serratia TaxID=613 RepID=A0A9X9BZD2_9GAMM|nr:MULTISPECIES: tyrosine-type recombinase/integrase [Serratia]MBS3893598.1 tyrosine-type recombinase/integrase [Serratia marcescens]TXE26697.1 tyrosine-type recombinase/integrase [Serratia ureilytica]